MTLNHVSSKENKYEATGKWIVQQYWNDEEEALAPVVVDPQGNEWARYSSRGVGYGEAQGYVDTFNMNKDLAAEFRTCPYCRNGCPWCG